MDDILAFISGLNEHQKKELHSFFSEKKTMASRIICGLLEGKNLRPHIEREIGTTPSTFNKACTEAKQELIEEVKKLVLSPFDDVYLLRTLVLGGHFATALKYSTQLEKLFEIKQQWQHLELLYIEISRMCQATGDLKLTSVISKKRIRNAGRLKGFAELSAELNQLLFEFEVYEKKKLPVKFVRQLDQKQKKARSLGHYTLIHNALQLEYLYYSRYTNNYVQARKYAFEIYKNRDHHQQNLNDITAALALNAYLNYLFIYQDRSPDNLVEDLRHQITVAGKHAEINFYYGWMDYLLYEGRSGELNELLRFLEPNDNTKFTVYRQSIEALKYFAEGNFDLFRQSMSSFYMDASRLDFPEAECMLRIAEVIRLIADRKEDDALYKLNALRVFIDRNLSERYNYEREIVSMLTRYVNRRVKPVQWKEYLEQLGKAPYRNIRFLGRILTKDLI
jgi:hypothetical protein